MAADRDGRDPAPGVVRLTPVGRPPISKSTKLADVCYDIRGPVLREAHRLRRLQRSGDVER
ncbi:MAG: hypothetical protein ACE5IK_06930, partial [Acidobacteriota bacterium]